jgi:hypothetical protein
MTTIDHRKNAETHIERLTSALEGLPPTPERDALLSECRALAVAIRAFHMEGIRFRMFNVDRMLAKGAATLGPAIADAFREARESLEAAGFHTRSHHA